MLPTLVGTVVLAAIYVAAAKLGFILAFEAEQVTVVWPPTGIALVIILLLGKRFIPAIALGAFLANFTTDESFFTASAIAAGNTMEAVAAAWLLHRFARFNPSLSRVKDVLSLIVFSAIISTMIAATIGVTSLCASGLQSWAQFSSLWMQWWLGDASGALIVAPVLLVWKKRPHIDWTPRDMLEVVVLIAGLLLVSAAIFSDWSMVEKTGEVLIYMVFPFVI